MSEYAIALDVFDRNPSTYYPGEDPVVRVQMGRLRKRLVSYYAVSPKDSPVIVSIPLGHYEPVIERRVQESTAIASGMQSLLALFPLHYISDDFLGRTLTKAVNAQLSQQFQQAYGASLIPYSALHNTENPHSYFLEGSTFIHAQSMRINIRLIDQSSHAILYTAQFVLPTDAHITFQLNTAEQMCKAVQEFMHGV
jgi:TolB-like protein